MSVTALDNHLNGYTRSERIPLAIHHGYPFPIMRPRRSTICDLGSSLMNPEHGIAHAAAHCTRPMSTPLCRNRHPWGKFYLS